MTTIESHSRIEQVLAAVSGISTRACDEHELQDALFPRLSSLGFEREVDLGEFGRVDFFDGLGIAIEVKTKGAAYDVVRQVQRYTQSERVWGVVLLTTRSEHVVAIKKLQESTSATKPILCVQLRSWP